MSFAAAWIALIFIEYSKFSINTAKYAAIGARNGSCPNACALLQRYEMWIRDRLIAPRHDQSGVAAIVEKYVLEGGLK